MKIHIKLKSTHVGNVEIHDLFHVTELDSGLITGLDEVRSLADGTLNVSLSHTSLHAIEMNLAIIVPCMNEEHPIIEGVLHGVPHDCLIILVSNSTTENFKAECKILTDFCANTQRKGLVVHQQDSGLAQAFLDAGMPCIMDNTAEPQQRKSAGHIRNGKGEAMIIGTALAKLAGKQFVGFIDADNFVPGAVHEYCKVYAAGLHYALHGNDPDNADTSKQPHVMVRIKWKSKTKIIGGKLVSQESGRCSCVVNKWMNRLLNSTMGESIDHDLIKTANAGEHAMSIDLALQLFFATSYAVEPFQLINAWERSGKFPPTPSSTPPQLGFRSPASISPAPLARQVKILQIETLNPHIHDFYKGEQHILRMQIQGLGTVYHSGLASQVLKDELKEYIKEELSPLVGEEGEPQHSRVYTPMECMDFAVFKEVLEVQASTLQTLGGF